LVEGCIERLRIADLGSRIEEFFMRSLVCVGLVALFSSLVPALAADESMPEARHAAIVEALSPSLVQVEYTLQYDKGEAPRAIGWAERCPSCGRYHAQEDLEELIRQERPLSAAGFVLSPTQVLSRDLILHPRFIKQIVVRQGDQAVAAKPESYARDEVAVVLRLDKPLTSAKALTFDAAKPPPYVAISCGQRQGSPRVNVRGISPGEATSTWDSRRVWSAPFASLIVDADGTPVGAAMLDELPLDDTWKGSPLKWQLLPTEEVNESPAARRIQAGGAVAKVTLTYRSPKQGRRGGAWGWGGDERNAGTEQNVAGVLLEGNRVLVLWQSPPTATARLTRILVHPAEGEAAAAKFVGTLKDYGGFIAELEKPMTGAASLAANDIREFRDKLLLGQDVTFQGEKRVAYFMPVRFNSLAQKWRGQVFPLLVGSRESTFVYDTAGRLVAVPINRRERVTERERWSGADQLVLLPGAYLKEMLANLPANVDPSNVPLDEDHENRLAWLGVTLQGLDRELARAKDVSDQTRDGESGAVVSHVYPDSPAAKAGVEPGFILLRLYVEGEPKPLEVKVDHDEGQSFPWEMLDDAPEEAFDQIPTPWPSAENEFARALTDLGFGKRYKAEFFHDGKVLTKDFEIVEGPPYFESAPRYKSQAVGLTVRDLTYEVRRYFQKGPDDPGVVVSKIEPGSKAAVAGMKPFEVITHVNDAPIRDVKEFEKLIADQTELRLAVKRLTTGRIVKIKMTGPTSAPTSKPHKHETTTKPSEDGEEP
jgi:hypothetical protein